MTGNMIGRVFNNRYQITELIGVGGMAEVYRAQDNVLGRTVAVKVMLAQYATDSSFTQRFKQEAASAANLQNPYIVNIYDWGQDDGTYYIVMEYVRGSDLKTAINQRGAINQRKVAEIGSQVCQALSVAHGLDIIHRDIKPQNIMVQPDGNVKVMDFGIARAKNSTKTQTSSVLGTAHYISPEQAQGKDLTPASDIYSLGVVMYEATTGQLPFDGPDAISVAMKQVNEQPLMPSEVNPSIDPTLEAIILKAMEKNPADRFATVNDMRQTLTDYLAGRPVTFNDGFTSAQTQVVGAAAVADATAVMKPVSTNHSDTTQNTGARSYDKANTKKKKRGKTIAQVLAVIAALVIIAVFVVTCSGSGSQTVTVPDVTGLTKEAAVESLEGEGLEVEIEEENSDTVESGVVMSQDPEAGEEAEEGSTVTIVVSLGEAEVTVPDLTGMTAEEAEKALTADGLVYVEGEAEYSDDVEEGCVISQSPEADSQVAQDTEVTVVLSLGPEGISVPGVVGETENSAKGTLKNAGFSVTVDTQYSDDVAAGYVISQSPSSGSRAQKGDTVNIVVSLGKETVTYSVSVSSNGGGTVTTTAYSVEEGGSVTIYITPDSGYEVATASGISGVSSSGGTYTISNVSGDVTVSVTFQAVATSQDTTADSDDAAEDSGEASGGEDAADEASQ